MMESQVDDIGQDPQGFAVKIGKELQEKGQEIRITILDSGGNVIGDSGIGEQGTLPAENHLYRPEIQQAQKEDIGYDTRKSDSVQKEYYYAAVQVGDRYFLRAALPTEEMNHAVTMVWMYATPIFYPETILPQEFRFVLNINPLYHFLRSMRMCILDGISPEPFVYVQCFGIALAMLLIGALIFKIKQDRFVLYL